MAKGVPGVTDGRLVFVVEGCGQAGVAHIECLSQVYHLFEIVDPLIVDIEEEVDEVEGLEDVADATTAIEVECTVKTDALCPEGVSRRNETDHSVGDGDAVIVSGVDLVGGDGPGIG